MIAIQPLLVIGILILLAFYLVSFRSQIFDRLLAFLLSGAAVLAVMFPSLTTTVGKLLGVGRGADLVFYLFIVTFSFALILTRTKIARLSESQTKLTREMALNNSIFLGESGKDGKSP